MQKKKNKITPENMMKRIKLEGVRMKPKWYFVAGSGLLFVSLVILSVGVMFLLNLVFFALRAQGPMIGWKFSMMMSRFPWWGLILSLLGMIAGVDLLKKYDFSYKKNFNLLVVIFVLTLLVAGLLFDRMGLNEGLMKRRPMMRHFYDGVKPKRLGRDFVEVGERVVLYGHE